MADKSKSNAQQQLKTSSTPNAACCIIPPMELWYSIQSIRELHDKSYPKWPPHINLAWPFVQSHLFDTAAQTLADIIKSNGIKPFVIRLAEFAYTPGSKYVYLIPTVVEKNPPTNTKTKGGKKAKDSNSSASALPPHQRLVDLVLQIFPQCRREASSREKSNKGSAKTKSNEEVNTMELHMTVGQFDQTTIAEEVARLQASWEPIEFEVTEICFIAREGSNDAFSVRKRIPLVSE